MHLREVENTVQFQWYATFPGSLKQPSRRRPVSVDYDGKTGPSVGSLSLLHKVGGAQPDNNRMSYYSNRSSQPLTDREVEQGFQYYNQKDKGTSDKENGVVCVCVQVHINCV